jgi:hypothetical protein
MDSERRDSEVTNFPYNPKRKKFFTLKPRESARQTSSPLSRMGVTTNTGFGVNSIYYREPSIITPNLKKIITGGRTTQKPEVGNIILENLKNKVKRQALGMYMQQDADLQR